MALMPDEPNREEREEKLPEDYDTPFRPADDAVDDPADQNKDREHVAEKLDDTHPSTDTNIMPEEEYDEGVSGAAEASEPNAGNTVQGYDPSHDQRKQTP